MKIFTWRQRVIVLTTTLFSVALFALAGFFIDIWLDSAPIALFVSIFLSFPVTQILLVKRLRKHLEKHPWKS